MTTGFNMVDQVRYWSYKILPLVYDESLSYMETQAKVIAALNTLIENNNKIPDFIKEQFAAFIESDEMRTMIATLVTSLILNVKFPPEGITPARGNGMTDDTEAIQGCIDFADANGGGAVYIPYGTYFTRPLTMKENVTLYGDSADATRLLLKSGANAPMITAHCDNVRFYDICLDGNITNQINRVNVIDFIGSGFTLSNAIVTGGKNCAYLKSSENGVISISNVQFGYAIENHLNLYDGNGESETEYVPAVVTVRDCIFKELSETQPAALKHCIINSYRFARFLNVGLFAVAPHSAVFNMGDLSTYTGIAPNTPLPVYGGSNCNISFDQGLTQIDTPDDYRVFSRGKIELLASETLWINGTAVKISTGNNEDFTIQTMGTGRIKYMTPENLSSFFDFVEFKDESGAPYKLLVANAGTQNVGTGGTGGGTGDGIELPAGGTLGQVLALGESGLVWLDIPDALPAEGTTGQVLTKGETGAIWQDVPTELPINGTDGQVLTVTETGLAWGDLPTPPTGVPTPIPALSGRYLMSDGNGGMTWVSLNPFPQGGTINQALLANGEGGASWGNVALLNTDSKVLATQATAKNETIAANYTIVAADNGKRKIINAASDITITFNAGILPSDAEIEFIQVGEGKATFVGGSGFTLNSSNGFFQTIGVFSRVGFCTYASNTGLVGGDLT